MNSKGFSNLESGSGNASTCQVLGHLQSARPCAWGMWERPTAEGERGDHRDVNIKAHLTWTRKNAISKLTVFFSCLEAGWCIFFIFFFARCCTWYTHFTPILRWGMVSFADFLAYYDVVSSTVTVSAEPKSLHAAIRWCLQPLCCKIGNGFSTVSFCFHVSEFIWI